MKENDALSAPYAGIEQRAIHSVGRAEWIVSDLELTSGNAFQVS